MNWLIYKFNIRHLLTLQSYILYLKLPEVKKLCFTIK